MNGSVPRCSAVDQLVARGAHIPEVAGSSPDRAIMSPSAVSYARGPLELARLRRENRALRRRVAALEVSRARWKSEASAWKWGALRRSRSARKGEAVSPTGAAEASVGG